MGTEVVTVNELRATLITILVAGEQAAGRNYDFGPDRWQYKTMALIADDIIERNTEVLGEVDSPKEA